MLHSSFLIHQHAMINFIIIEYKETMDQNCFEILLISGTPPNACQSNNKSNILNLWH